MENQAKILVADTAFLDPDFIRAHNLVSVFPVKAGDGAFRASYESLLARSKKQSRFYDQALPLLVSLFERRMPEARSETKHFVRPILVYLTTLYTDRCLRVLHRLRSDDKFTVAKVRPMDCPQWPSALHGQTWQLNQDLIQRIGSSLGLQHTDIFPEHKYPEFPREHKQANLLFSPKSKGLKGFSLKVHNRYYRWLENFSSRNASHLNLGFTSDRFYFAKENFFGPFGHFQKAPEFELTAPAPDTHLRNDLKPALEKIFQPLFPSLFEEESLARGQEKALTTTFAHLFADWFPTGFLEGNAENLKSAARHLGPEIKDLIGHDVATPRGYFYSAAGRLQGKKIIGVQHGGHYGYIEDLSSVAQIEFFLYDEMLTWGWTEIEPHLPQCVMKPLPCPKLSSSPLAANYVEGEPEQADVLFYSNLFHRFPYASTSGHSRVDFLDEISLSHEDLVRALGQEQLSIRHKPYSMKFVDLYPEHFRKLEVAGGPKYQLITSAHKGLSPEVIKSGKVLLWDQIGTGTLECFTSGVPTMIYWKRIYSRESAAARDLISQLEKTGVVHSDPSRLAREVKSYLEDPENWMKNQERQSAIRAFCQKFALTHPSWDKIWKNYLKGASNGA